MGRLLESERAELWDRWEAGESQRSIARALGRSPSTVRTVLVSSQWRRPVPPREWSSVRLSLAEREEISRGIAEGLSLRAIAGSLGQLAAAAHSLNSRPRQTLNWMTPSQKLAEALQ